MGPVKFDFTHTICLPSGSRRSSSFLAARSALHVFETVRHKDRTSNDVRGENTLLDSLRRSCAALLHGHRDGECLQRRKSRTRFTQQVARRSHVRGFVELRTALVRIDIDGQPDVQVIHVRSRGEHEPIGADIECQCFGRFLSGAMLFNRWLDGRHSSGRTTFGN